MFSETIAGFQVTPMLVLCGMSWNRRWLHAHAGNAIKGHCLWDIPNWLAHFTENYAAVSYRTSHSIIDIAMDLIISESVRYLEISRWGTDWIVVAGYEIETGKYRRSITPREKRLCNSCSNGKGRWWKTLPSSVPQIQQRKRNYIQAGCSSNSLNFSLSKISRVSEPLTP